MPSELLTPVSAATVTTVRTENSIYVLVEYPGEPIGTLTCVEGTFVGQRFRVHRESTSAPVAGDRWQVNLKVNPWENSDCIITTPILEVSTI